MPNRCGGCLERWERRSAGERATSAYNRRGALCISSPPSQSMRSGLLSVSTAGSFVSLGLSVAVGVRLLPRMAPDEWTAVDSAPE